MCKRISPILAMLVAGGIAMLCAFTMVPVGTAQTALPDDVIEYFNTQGIEDARVLTENETTPLGVDRASISLRDLQPVWALVPKNDGSARYVPTEDGWWAGVYVDGQPFGTTSVYRRDDGSLEFYRSAASASWAGELNEVAQQGGRYLYQEHFYPYSSFCWKDDQVTPLTSDSKQYVETSMTLDDFLANVNVRSQQMYEEYLSTPNAENLAGGAAWNPDSPFTPRISPMAIAVISVFGIIAIALSGFAIFRAMARKHR